MGDGRWAMGDERWAVGDRGDGARPLGEAIACHKT